MTDRQLPSDYPRTFHKANLTGDDYERGGEDRPVVSIDEANVVSSIRSGNTPTPLDPDSTEVPPAAEWVTHHPVLDLDIPVHLVPSSTPGHSHLYIDTGINGRKFWAMCDALAAAGVLQEGYVRACKTRGYTSVRLPWVKKEVTA